MAISLTKLQRQLDSYDSSKSSEIKEAKEATNYYHGNQWTAEELANLAKRKQPPVTYNRVVRKINGAVGLIEKMRRDPKAYPVTPKHEEGAEIATAVLRYTLEASNWRALSVAATLDCATNGLSGVEVNLIQGDHGDPDVELSLTTFEDFFYDPRSKKPDFSDSRFMGTAKWLGIDEAKELFPDKVEELENAKDSGTLSQKDAGARKWIDIDEGKIYLVDHWYIENGDWFYCLYCADLELMRGKSYLVNDRGKTICRYVMFSCNIDQDYDRYGFVRSLKSAQDEINYRRSKGLHTLHSRRIIAEHGAVQDPDEARLEASRPDAFLLVNSGHRFEFDDASKAQDMRGQFEYLQEAKQEIENYGPNPALIGTGIENKSGRAIALMQEAGISELGPFILQHKDWKIRIYRAIWAAVKQNWTAERWIRVTDDEDLAQFIQVNGFEMTPTGPVAINQLGSIDVDIVLDEGIDVITTQQETFETMTKLMPQLVNLSPPMQQLFVEMSPLPLSMKKKYTQLIEQTSQPDPVEEQAKQVELAGKTADVKKTEADTAKTMAETAKANADTRKQVLDTTLQQMATVPFMPGQQTASLF